MAILRLILFGLVCAGVVFGSDNCGQLFGRIVSPQEAINILNKHNELRSLVSEGKLTGQPKAANLGLLKWNKKLAQTAQKVADTCEFQHSKIKDLGENLGWSSSSLKEEANWPNVIQRWFDEHKNFIYPNKSNGVTGHYTQVVWADTKYVGCGYTAYRKRSDFEHLYVCHYYPSGNVLMLPPYKTSN